MPQPTPRAAQQSPSSIAPLRPEQVAHWREQGYVAVPDFLSADAVQALQTEVRCLQSAGLLRNVATEGDGKTVSRSRANLQICPVAPHSRLLRALAHDQRIQSAIGQLLGPGRILHWLDQIFLKPAGHGAGTGWHTDNAYWGVREVVQGTGMWIAVHEARRDNGTMRVVPGSHRRELPHVRDSESDHHITCKQRIDESEAVTVELPAGGALFFNFGIAHATGPNPTSRDRAGLAYHFLRADGRPRYGTPGERYYSDAMHCDDGGQEAWGEDLRGAFAAMCRDVARIG